MKIFLMAIILGISVTSFSANARCLVELMKSDFLVHDGSVLVERNSGYFQEFATEFTKAGYDVCIGADCEGQKVDLRFQAVFSTMLERSVLPFGYHEGDYYTAFAFRLNDRQSTHSYSSPNLKSAMKSARGILRKKIPRCH